MQAIDQEVDVCKFSSTAPIVQVPFYGTDLHAVQQGDQIWVVVKRICEVLGIDFKTQHRKLQNKPWAVMVMMTTTGSDGKNYEMCCLSHKALPMWLATIEPSRVKPEARDMLERFQIECAEVLERHFFGGSVRVRSSQFEEAISQIVAQQGQQISAVIDLVAQQGQQLAVASKAVDAVVFAIQSLAQKTAGLQGYVQSGVIGKAEANKILKKLMEYAVIMARINGGKGTWRKWRARADCDLRSGLGFTGVGTKWKCLPQSKLGDALLRLDEMLARAKNVDREQGDGPLFRNVRPIR